MIGFKPAKYQNNEDGSVIKIIQVTRNNAADVEEWAEEYSGDSHEIIPSEDPEDVIFTIAGENSHGSYFEVDILVGMFLAVDDAGYFFEFDDFADQEDEYTRLS